MTEHSDKARTVELRGSARHAPPHPKVGEVDPTELASISIYLRGPEIDEAARIGRDEFVATYGASNDDIASLTAFASDHHLSVDDIDRSRRRIELSGALGDLAAAFGTELSLHGENDRHYRARQGALRVPESVAGIVVGVFGLDERPQATPKFRVADTPSVSYTPPQVAAAYNFPSGGVTGTGECVALIELGGGFREADITAYFASLGITAPPIEAIPVDKGANTPGSANGPDGEVMLDIEVVGSVAPGVSIAVYFAPNTDQGFLDAVTTAVHDTEHKPSVVSISWGGPESTWTSQAMQTMEQAFISAAVLGVTITVASGDNGSTDGVTDGLQHVDFPASAPHALACGGTRLEIRDEQITAESVWNDGSSGGAGGGGISVVFPLPSYQNASFVPPSVNPGAKPGRGVPDVAGDADPDSGYSVRVDGNTMTIGGTSAVAPLWAGLIALMNEHLGSTVGFVHQSIYARATVFHDIVTGSNGAYSAKAGWDACTGLGTPDGATLLTALSADMKP